MSSRSPVDVNNGIDPHGMDFLYVEAVTIPPASDPAGANAGDPALPNPDTGDTIALTDSRDGVIQGNVSSTRMGATDYFTSTFGDPDDTNADGRISSTLLHHFTNPGIFILECEHEDSSGSSVSKTRKTLAFSDSEIAPDPNSTIIAAPAAQRKLAFQKLKGKFNFQHNNTVKPGGAKSPSPTLDKVTLSWQMTLPVGWDVEADTQNIMIGVGNVVDSLSLSRTGTGVLDSQPSPYKAVKFKLPRLKKGVTLVTAPFKTTVSVTLSAADLTGLGFDTEGISPLAKSATNPGPFIRNIQVATYFAGVSYSGIAKVSLAVSSNSPVRDDCRTAPEGFNHESHESSRRFLRSRSAHGVTACLRARLL